MSIQTTCPGCQSPFTLADSMLGKKIRCGKCQEVFTVKAASRKRRDEEFEEVEEVLAAEEDEPRSRIRTPPPAAGRVETRRAKGAASAGGITDKRRDDEPLHPPIAQPKSNVPLLVGGAVACVALLVGGGITIAWMMRGDSKPEAARQAVPHPASVEKTQVVVTTPPTAISPPPAITPPVAIQPTAPLAAQETKAPEPAPPARSDPPRSDATRRGELTREVREEVKRATVFLRVTLPDDTTASGSGFFGAPDSPNIILTNAHVVGMLSPTSRKPKKVEVVLNSGQKDEKATAATILGVDRASDLAVLDVGTTHGMPRPLSVKSGDDLQQLDKVYVFGFPYGEGIGKEISIRPATVSSKRLKAGVLERIQVEGGMSPGNSGGPLVDDTGHVVGVAVAGIPGSNINFAIPGSRVEAILNGRVMEMLTGQAYRSGEQMGVPVALNMIDPRRRVKEVFLDVWAGNAPHEKEPVRPPASSPPPAQEGDTSRQRVPLTYTGGVARDDVPLPPLPPGKVWWLQGGWTTIDGKKYWDFATVYKPASPPVERRGLLLTANYRSARPRRLDVNTTTRFKVGVEAEAEVASIVNKASLLEQGASNANGTTLKLTYRNVDQTLTVNKRKITLPQYDLARSNLKGLIGVVDLDRFGNVRENSVAMVGELAGSEASQALMFVHQPTRFALYPLLLGMPNKHVAPKETWKTTRQIAVDTIGSPRQGTLDLTCTYMGVRAVGGRDEAVIALEGIIRDPAMAGRARGQAILDVSSSTIKKVELDLEVDMPPLEIALQEGKKQKLRVLSVVSMQLERSL